jgi:hypothetical protein
MANEPIIDVDLGQHNGTLKFFSTQEIHDFTQNEQNFWSWLNSSPVNRQIKQPWNVISQHISQIQNQLPGFGDGSDEGNRGLMQDHLRRVYVAGRRICIAIKGRVPNGSCRRTRFMDEHRRPRHW